MVEKIVLANGLTILLEEIPFIRSIAIGFWVKNGSRNEEKSENGISHFIEHMLFKGTSTRSAKDIADDMDAIGGQLNAYTSKEHTCYYTRVLDSHFDKAFEIMSDMFFNSNFDDEEIEKEKNVILEEINMYEDTPEDLVHDILQKKIFHGDSLGSSILGTKKSVNSFARKDFVNYVKAHYCPENTVIALAGNFKSNEILSKIESYFAEFKSDNYVQKSYNTVYGKAIASAEKKIEQLHLCIAFPGIKLDSEFSYAISIFNTLFGGGMSSRLFQKIREDKGLVYTIYSYPQSYMDIGLYAVYAALSPSQLSDAFKYIIEEVEKARIESVTELQINRAKEQLKSSYMMSLESSSSRMSSIGRSQLMLGRILTPDETLQKIDGVTAEDLSKLTKLILNTDEMSISAVGRMKNIDLEGLTNAAK